MKVLTSLHSVKIIYRYCFILLIFCGGITAANAQNKVVVVPLGGTEPTGNAQVADVVGGKTFSNANGVGLTGVRNLTPLLKTGQNQCYESGMISNGCDASQDGFWQAGEAIPNRWNTVLNVVVFDSATGLVWEKIPSNTAMNFQNAAIHCSTRAVNTSSGIPIIDWRLPNIRELQSLVDYGNSTPAMAASPFVIQSSTYWSNTSDHLDMVFNSNWSIRVVDFSSGNTFQLGPATTHRVWCVK